MRSDTISRKDAKKWAITITSSVKRYLFSGLAYGLLFLLILVASKGLMILFWVYMVFLAWLLNPTILAFKNLSGSWKAVVFDLWFFILVGLYSLYSMRDLNDIGLFFLAGFLIGIGIAGLAVPLTIAGLSSSNQNVSPLPGRVPVALWLRIKWLCVIAGLVSFILGFIAIFSALLLLIPIALLFQVTGIWLATNPRHEPSHENAW